MKQRVVTKPQTQQLSKILTKMKPSPKKTKIKFKMIQNRAAVGMIKITNLRTSLKKMMITTTDQKITTTQQIMAKQMNKTKLTRKRVQLKMSSSRMLNIYSLLLNWCS